MHSVYWLSTPEHTDFNTQGYIGITNNIDKRFKEHCNSTGTHLSRAISKHGWDSIKKTVLVEDVDRELALLIEAMLRPQMQIGWNIAPGGGGGCAIGPLPEDWKIKISLSNIGKKRTEEHKVRYSQSKQGQNNPMFGKFGPDCCNFKYVIEATCLETGATTLLYGGKHMESLGFDNKKVYSCANGKRKSHRGHTFRKIIYGE